MGEGADHSQKLLLPPRHNAGASTAASDVLSHQGYGERRSTFPRMAVASANLSVSDALPPRLLRRQTEPDCRRSTLGARMSAASPFASPYVCASDAPSQPPGEFALPPRKTQSAILPKSKARAGSFTLGGVRRTCSEEEVPAPRVTSPWKRLPAVLFGMALMLSLLSFTGLPSLRLVGQNRELRVRAERLEGIVHDLSHHMHLDGGSNTIFTPGMRVYAVHPIVRGGALVVNSDTQGSVVLVEQLDRDSPIVLTVRFDASAFGKGHALRLKDILTTEVLPLPAASRALRQASAPAVELQGVDLGAG